MCIKQLLVISKYLNYLIVCKFCLCGFDKCNMTPYWSKKSHNVKFEQV